MPGAARKRAVSYLNVTGQDAWLRENLGADLVQGVKSLATGECYVDLRKVAGVSKPVRTRLFAT